LHFGLTQVECLLEDWNQNIIAGCDKSPEEKNGYKGDKGSAIGFRSGHVDVFYFERTAPMILKFSFELTKRHVKAFCFFEQSIADIMDDSMSWTYGVGSDSHREYLVLRLAAQ
jgi:hypothetical protein